MKNIYFRTVILAALGITIVASSCKKFLEVDNPVDQLTTSAVFKDSTSATSTVLGFYSALMDRYGDPLNGGVTISASMSSDEIYQATAGATPNQFDTNNLVPINPENFAIWSGGYIAIYQSNLIIENLQKSGSLNVGLKAKLIAEMKGMRAMLFFYLVNLYGDVPLAISTDFRVNATMPRSDSNIVTAQVFSDLMDAQAYYNSSNAGEDNIRMDKWAIAALLSRAYLYQKDWVNASLQASLVINSGKFSLPGLTDVFKNNSPEVILQFMPSTTGPYNSNEGYGFIPYSDSDLPTYALRPELLSAFEKDDLRKTSWLGKNNYDGADYYYPYKYKVKEEADYTLKTEYNVVLRLAEQYLNRAEAYCQQGNLPGAIADLDKVRVRAGLIPIAQSDPSINQNDLLRKIYHERQIELFAEWGHRWFDLKRTSQADQVLAPIKGSNWQSTDQFYPIPEDEIIANPKLQQNEGY